MNHSNGRGRARSRPASEDLHQERCEQVMATVDRLFAHSRRLYRTKPMNRDVSISQVHILINLQEYGPTMVSDVAAQLQISTPSASTILDRMEEHGLVERTRDPSDRRVVRAAITDQGRVVLDEITGIKRAKLARLLATMTAEEVGDVLRGAEALHRGLVRMEESAVEATA